MSFKGHKHTEETKAKISASLKGKKKSPEAIANMSAAKTGMVFTEDHRKKLSEVRKGHPVSDSTIEAFLKNKNYLGRKVIISGVEYKSMSAAAKALGIRYQYIVGMCRNNPEEFADYGLHLDWVEKK